MKRMIDWLKDLVDDVFVTTYSVLAFFQMIVRVLVWVAKNAKRLRSKSVGYVQLVLRMKYVEAIFSLRVFREAIGFEYVDDEDYEGVVIQAADSFESGFNRFIHIH